MLDNYNLENTYPELLYNDTTIEIFGKNLEFLETLNSKHLNRKISMIDDTILLLKNNINPDKYYTSESNHFIKEVSFLIRRFGKKKGIKLFHKLKNWTGNDNSENDNSEELLYTEGTMLVLINEDIFFISMENSIKHMVSIFSYSQCVRIIESMLSNKIGSHDFVANYPIKTTDKYYSDSEISNEYINEAYRFLINGSSKYSKENFLSLLPFINYKKIRLLDGNIEQLNAYINIVVAARSGVIFVGDTSEVNHTMFEIPEQIDPSFYFSKESVEINTIGNRTLCCFSPNGLAKDLLPIALESPIAGIITGKYWKTNNTWFSFVWEIVEKVKLDNDTFVYETSLVLDNVEASKKLNQYETIEIKNKLSKLNYKKIYIGSSRNDLDLNSLIAGDKLSKGKPYNLVYYEKQFSRYSYDDSRTIIKVMENNDISDIVIERVTDVGWYHRLSFRNLIEKDNKFKYSKKDFECEDFKAYIKRDINTIYGAVTIKDGEIVDEFGSIEEIKQFIDKDMED